MCNDSGEKSRRGEGSRRLHELLQVVGEKLGFEMGLIWGRRWFLLLYIIFFLYVFLKNRVKRQFYPHVHCT
ncbi:hypothetical protein HanRHA438_Chr15g0730131 [Helianthus annuus]|nr:hypothetical protein HanRHA438_Chr15g0730131 [Helianthus annuus]